MYFAVSRHKNQIQELQATPAGEETIFSSLIRSAVGIFYVYLVFLLCYLPYLISLVATKMNGPSMVLKGFSSFSFTLAYLNSSLNPVIYCWKMRHIRHAVINILRNMSRHGSRSSHEPLEAYSGTLSRREIVRVNASLGEIRRDKEKLSFPISCELRRDKAS